MHLENTLVWSTTCFPRFVSLLLDKMLYFSKPSFLFKLIHVFTFGVSVGKESAWSAGDLGSIPGSAGSPGEGNGNPLQYSCLENRMSWGGWWDYSPWGPKESDTTERLSTHRKSCKPFPVFLISLPFCLLPPHFWTQKGWERAASREWRCDREWTHLNSQHFWCHPGNL